MAYNDSTEAFMMCFTRLKTGRQNLAGDSVFQLAKACCVWLSLCLSVRCSACQNLNTINHLNKIEIPQNANPHYKKTRRRISPGVSFKEKIISGSQVSAQKTQNMHPQVKEMTLEH